MFIFFFRSLLCLKKEEKVKEIDAEPDCFQSSGSSEERKPLIGDDWGRNRDHSVNS